MDEQELVVLFVFGLLIAFAFIGFLAMPIQGNLFGYEINIPLIGWIGLGALCILVLIIAVIAFFRK